MSKTKETLTEIIMPAGEKRGQKVKVTPEQADEIHRIHGEYRPDKAVDSAAALAAENKALAAEVAALRARTAALEADLETATKPSGANGAQTNGGGA